MQALRASRIVVVGAVLICLTTAGAAPENNDRGLDVSAVIRLAGNADDDAVRLRYLTQLAKRDGLEDAFREELGRLIQQIERWMNDKSLAYFGREVRNTQDFDFGIPSSSELYPLTYLYRGRMLTWYALESGSVWNDPQRKSRYLGKARRYFEKAAEYFPENIIVRMYLGYPIAPRKQYASDPNAPAWAVYQREGLERLTDIIEWWIDNRMRSNGEYGGGWGDDCEMWRWWVPVLIGFESEKIGGAQARFSEALLSQPHMRGSYTSRMSDVEHTAEDSADTITPMMHLDPDDEQWNNRALRLARLMESLWTGTNERGFLQFKSTYFTVDRVDTTPQRACDTVYHPRAVQPALLYWQRTGDQRLTDLFSAWMDTWVDAAARAKRGKPAGTLPTAIHWPDGRVGGLGPDWWDPRNHGEYTLYLYPSAMGMMTHTLLLTYHMTGEHKYLEPIRSMAKMRLRYLASRHESDPAPGSETWCAARMGFLSGVIAKYKFLTGSDEFDVLLAKDASPYMRLRLRGDLDSLTEALRHNAEALQINLAGYTSEVRYTDRVLRFPTLFGRGGLVADPAVQIRRPDPRLLYSTVTGDPGGAEYFPLNAVRWLTPPRDIAALVVKSGEDAFEATLFNFRTEQRRMGAELYLLKRGRYTLTVSVRSRGQEATLQTHRLTSDGHRSRALFYLPARRLCVLRVSPEPQRDRSAVQ